MDDWKIGGFSQSSRTTAALLNATIDAVVLLDPQGIVLDLNNSYAQRFHKSIDEMIGTRIWDLFPPEVSGPRMANVEKVFQTGKPVRMVDLRDGMWNDANIYPIFDSHGKVTQVAVFAHDITERKQTEEAEGIVIVEEEVEKIRSHRSFFMENAISISYLSKYFGKISAVDEISFDVRKGELFGFLGPNGAGKTTTQRMLTGVLKPDSGTIHIMDFDLSKNPFDAKMSMGVVPEMSNVYIDLSAWDNLMLMGELYGVPKKKREQKAIELLEMFELQDRKKQKTKGFSKGMKRRLILAIALIHEPELLLLDEPTSGLDVQSTRLIRSLIRELNQNGVTVFLTTHNIEEANQMCDRVAIINQGKIVAIDRPENLRNVIQSSQSVKVAFGKQIDDLEPLQAIETVNEVRKEGDKLRLYTDKPGDVVCQLVEYANAHGLQILTLNTLGPSLEEVFVHLTNTKGE